MLCEHKVNACLDKQVEITIHNMQKKKNINNIVQKVKLVQLQV